MKPWATDGRLRPVGLRVDSQRHARDAAPCPVAAAWDHDASEPLSTR